MPREDRELRQQAGRAESALAELETLPDSHERFLAFEAVQALVELYGSGLRRICEALAEADAALLNEVADDEVVGHLLILHDLHPLPLEDRVHVALDDVRPYLQSHDGDVELLGIEQGVVRLRVLESGRGCPSSANTLKLAIEEAVWQRAPDIERIEAVNPQTAVSNGAFIPLASLRRSTESTAHRAGLG